MPSSTLFLPTMWLELSSFTIFFLAASFPATTTSSSSATLGLPLQMSHVSSVARNSAPAHLLKRSNERSAGRIDGHYDGTNFLVEVSIGTSPKNFTAALSTGGDLIMTQCKPCTKCIPQHGPLFDPRESSSFSPLPCSHELCQSRASTNCSNRAPPPSGCEYSYSHFGRMTTQGFLGKESFAFGSGGGGAVRVPGLVFGCGMSQRGKLAPGSSGIVGLGRGPLSLVSQMNVSRFSHCFAYDAPTCPLFLGTLAKLDDGGGEPRSTRLLRSPARPALYYLPLEGITVGGTRLPIPPSAFELREDGSGGTVIDSAFTIMQLNGAAFEQVAEALRSQMSTLPAVDGTDSTGYEICFESPESPPIDVLPEMILHFEGADMDLQVNNYLGHIDGLLCVLAERSIYEWSIIGNRATKDMHVLYDLEKEMLSFQPAKCSEL